MELISAPDGHLAGTTWQSDTGALDKMNEGQKQEMKYFVTGETRLE